MPPQINVDFRETAKASAVKYALEREKLRKQMSEYIFNSLNILTASLKTSPFLNAFFSALSQISVSSSDDIDVSFGKLEDIFKEMASHAPNYPLNDLLDKEKKDKKEKYGSKAAFGPILAPFQDSDSIKEFALSRILDFCKIPYNEASLPIEIVEYSLQIFEFYQKMEEQLDNVNSFLDTVVPDNIEPLYQIMASYQSSFGNIEQHGENEKFKNAQISMAQSIIDQMGKGISGEQLEKIKDSLPYLDIALKKIKDEDLSWLQPRYNQLDKQGENPETAYFNLYLFRSVFDQIESSIANYSTEDGDKILKESQTNVSVLSQLLNNLEINAFDLSNYWGTIERWASLGLKTYPDSPFNNEVTVNALLIELQQYPIQTEKVANGAAEKTFKNLRQVLTPLIR